MLALIDRLLYIETQFTRKLKRGHYKHWNQGLKDPRTQGLGTRNPRTRGPKDPRTGDQKPNDPRTQGPKDRGPETQGPKDPRTQGPGTRNPRTQGPKDPRTGDQKPKDPRTQGPEDRGTKRPRLFRAVLHLAFMTEMQLQATTGDSRENKQEGATTYLRKSRACSLGKICNF